MATLPNDVFTAHATITLGILRNGAPAGVARTARAAAIAPKYYFTGVRHAAALLGNAANRVPACPVAVVLEAQVRSSFGTIVAAAVEAARTAHPVGAAAFDEAAARAASAANAGDRLEAIAVGSGHTALVASFQLVDADLSETESAAATLALVPPAAAADPDAYRALLRTKTHGWRVRLESGHALADATEAELVMLNMAVLTPDELELAYALVSLGQVAPVRAGAQLFADGHHYHSNVDSSARHRAIEREVIGAISTNATNVWRANVAMLRNAIWHAAVHPVRAEILQEWAEDLDMPARLDATGFGSMSVGLPAQEDLFARAGSYTAVYNQVLQTATAHGHTLSIADLTATVTAMATLPRRGNLVGNRPALPGLPAAPWPAGCDTRAKALKLYLEPALNTAEPVAAWMFGFYREICSRAGIRANSPEGSLLRSYSLKRAVGNYLGPANSAQEMYSARARFIRAQAEEGHLETYTGRA